MSEIQSRNKSWSELGGVLRGVTATAMATAAAAIRATVTTTTAITATATRNASRLTVFSLFVFSFLFLFTLLSMSTVCSWAAFEGLVVDSKTAAMGDCWSSSDYCVHFLAPVPPARTNPSVSLCYCAPFGLPELEQKTVLLNVPSRGSTVTLGVVERGGSLYKERILSGAVSRKIFPSTRIMFSIGMFSLSISGRGEAKLYGLSAGLRSRPARSLEACVGLGNLASRSASDSQRETVPSTFLFGLTLTPAASVIAVGEVRKTPGRESSFHLGVQFEPQTGIRMRCGVQTVPVELALGFAIDVGPLSIESASSFHAVLGRTDIITLTYRGGEGGEGGKHRKGEKGEKGVKGEKDGKGRKGGQGGQGGEPGSADEGHR